MHERDFRIGTRVKLVQTEHPDIEARNGTIIGLPSYGNTSYTVYLDAPRLSGERAVSLDGRSLAKLSTSKRHG